MLQRKHWVCTGHTADSLVCITCVRHCNIIRKILIINFTFLYIVYLKSERGMPYTASAYRLPYFSTIVGHMAAFHNILCHKYLPFNKIPK